MTRNDIIKRYPRASESFIRANLDAEDTRLRPAAPKPVERLPLENCGEPENPHWYAAARQFEIRFTVYSVRPADWDGYDFKACQDFLVKIGIVFEDRWDVIVESSVRSRKAATEGEEKTTVEITALK